MTDITADVVFFVPKTKKGVLLFKNKKSGFWEFPAGPSNNSKSVMNVARRICFEHTNFEVKEVKKIGEQEITFEGREQIMTMVYYLGVLNEPIEEMQSDMFDKYLVYDEDNPPSPICSTCKMILSEYKKLEASSTY